MGSLSSNASIKHVRVRYIYFIDAWQKDIFLITKRNLIYEMIFIRKIKVILRQRSIQFCCRNCCQCEAVFVKWCTLTGMLTDYYISNPSPTHHIIRWYSYCQFTTPNDIITYVIFLSSVTFMNKAHDKETPKVHPTIRNTCKDNNKVITEQTRVATELI